MRPKRNRTRTLALVLTAGALSLAVAGTAGAVIFVYGNGFSSKSDFREVKRGGGGKRCDERHRDKAKSMLIELRGKRLCVYKPPVVGDSGRPNHAVWANGQIAWKKMPKPLRKHAYLAVRLRFGRGDYYELQIRPKGKRFRVERSPRSDAVDERGTSSAIKPLKKANKLKLEARGGRVTAFVNGVELASIADPDPAVVEGRKVGFGVGSRKSSSRPTFGAFQRVRVGIVE